MVERKKTVKKTKAGKAGKTTVKQQQTVKVIVGDIGKKKAVKRRPVKKPAPGLTRPATGAFSGVGISDRVVVPPFSRADPSLYNKDALRSLENQIKQLEYKSDNAQVNLAGYLTTQLQNRLTYRNDASNEAPEDVIEKESKKKKGPTQIDVRMNKIFDLAENLITEKERRQAGAEASGKKQRGRSKPRDPTPGPSLSRTLSNQFQQQQINKGLATEKGQEKKEEMAQPKFSPIGATSMTNKPLVFDDEDEGSKTPELVIEGMDFLDEVPEEKPKRKKAPLFKDRNK